MQDCWSFPCWFSWTLGSLSKCGKLKSFVLVLLWYYLPCTPRFWNTLPIECFTLTYNLNSFKARINRHLLTVCRFFLKKYPVCFNLFVLLFLVTPCLVVDAEPCMEWIPIKKKLPIDNTCEVVFGSTIGVASKDLSSDGEIDLLIE